MHVTYQFSGSSWTYVIQMELVSLRVASAHHQEKGLYGWRSWCGCPDNTRRDHAQTTNDLSAILNCRMTVWRMFASDMEVSPLGLHIHPFFLASSRVRDLRSRVKVMLVLRRIALDIDDAPIPKPYKLVEGRPVRYRAHVALKWRMSEA